MGRGAVVGRGGRTAAEKRQKCKLDSTSQAVYFPKTARSAGWQSNVSYQMCDFNTGVSKSCSSSFGQQMEWDIIAFLCSQDAPQ